MGVWSFLPAPGERCAVGGCDGSAPVFRVSAEEGGRSRCVCFACAIEQREKETSDCREMLRAVQSRLCASQDSESALRQQLNATRRELETAREETLRTRDSVEADFRRDLKEATRKADKAQSLWKEAERELRDNRELSSSLFAKNNVLIEELEEARGELSKAEKRQGKTLGVVRGCLKDMSERNNRWRRDPVLSYIESAFATVMSLATPEMTPALKNLHEGVSHACFYIYAFTIKKSLELLVVGASSETFEVCSVFREELLKQLSGKHLKLVKGQGKKSIRPTAIALHEGGYLELDVPVLPLEQLVHEVNGRGFAFTLMS